MPQQSKCDAGPKKKDRPTHSLPSEQGQGLLEMAFALPILVLLLAVAVDAGRVFDASIVLTNAVREGARFATIEPSPNVAQIQTLVVQDIVGSGTNISHMEDVGVEDVNVIMGTTAITVTVSYDFDLWFGGLLGVPTLTVSKQSVMPLYLPGTSP
jgi:Flp pilus assembly protein TadG